MHANALMLEEISISPNSEIFGHGYIQNTGSERRKKNELPYYTYNVQGKMFEGMQFNLPIDKAVVINWLSVTM